MGFAAQTAAWLYGLAASVVGYAPIAEPGQVKKVSDLEGKMVPAYSMPTPEGQILSREGNLGKVVLMDFWSSWCTVCKKASPQMQRLHTKYGEHGLVVIGVNALEEDGSTPKHAIAYKQSTGYTFPMTYGNDAFAARCGVQGLPSFILTDEMGKVVFTADYYSDKTAKDIEAEVSGLMARR